MHVRSGEAGGSEEPQAPLHGPGEGWKQGKTFRFHVPGFKVTSSLDCHSHLGTIWCSDCSNSCCKMISPGRTSLLSHLVNPGRCHRTSCKRKPWRTESSKGCRRGGRDGALGSLKLEDVSTRFGPAVLKQCNLQPGVLANVLASFQFLKKVPCGFHPWVDLWVI